MVPGLCRAENGAQAFVAGDQRGEGTLQRAFVQRAAQAYGGRDVVGGAVRLHLPEEPQARLCRRQWRVLAPLAEDRQARQAHAFLAKLAQEDDLFVLGERAKALRDLLQLGVHRVGHYRFSSSPSSSSIRSSSSSALAELARWASIQAASASILLSSNKRCSGNSRPRR